MLSLDRVDGEGCTVYERAVTALRVLYLVAAIRLPLGCGSGKSEKYQRGDLIMVLSLAEDA